MGARNPFTVKSSSFLNHNTSSGDESQSLSNQILESSNIMIKDAKFNLKNKTRNNFMINHKRDGRASLYKTNKMSKSQALIPKEIQDHNNKTVSND